MAREQKTAAASSQQRLVLLALLTLLCLPPLYVAVVDGVQAKRQIVSFFVSTVKHFDSYTRDRMWVSAALALSIERLCCRDGMR